ncbi:hypothetical protein [Halomonas urumqiensis]|nr:hypothetical protein [Halomonas urumqiensis]
MRSVSSYLSRFLLSLTFPRWRMTALLLVLLGVASTPLLVS